MKKISILMMVILLLITGCGTSANEAFEVVEDNTSTSKARKPSLEIEVKVKDEKVLLTFETDLTISKEHYGGEKKNGEGHIHVYLNNGEKQGVTKTPFELNNVKKGSNVVRVSLHNNDHTPYEVFETVEFQIE